MSTLRGAAARGLEADAVERLRSAHRETARAVAAVKRLGFVPMSLESAEDAIGTWLAIVERGDR